MQALNGGMGMVVRISVNKIKFLYVVFGIFQWKMEIMLSHRWKEIGRLTYVCPCNCTIQKVLLGHNLQSRSY